jgi:hypothetical protein
MSLNSNNHIKIGSSDLNSISVKDFSIGVRGGADYGPTSTSGFYNGITPPIGGYTIYVEKLVPGQGPSIHVPRTDQECLYYLNKYGANATNISDALTWADGQNNILVRSSEYTLSDLPGGNTGTTISGQWFLYSAYSSADNSNQITFPDHNNYIGSLNPNEVGQSGGGTATQIYINAYDSSITDHSADLSQLAGHAGTLTLTQGSNNVTYTFTNQSFQFGPYGGSTELYADWYFESSIQGSITVTSPASGDFNTVDPITITYTII